MSDGARGYAERMLDEFSPHLAQFREKVNRLQLSQPMLRARDLEGLDAFDDFQAMRALAESLSLAASRFAVSSERLPE